MYCLVVSCKIVLCVLVVYLLSDLCVMCCLRFDRDDGVLTRVIAGIFRHKFDGPYYSWKATPVHVREVFFRTFAVSVINHVSFSDNFVTLKT